MSLVKCGRPQIHAEMSVLVTQWYHIGIAHSLAQATDTEPHQNYRLYCLSCPCKSHRNSENCSFVKPLKSKSLLHSVPAFKTKDLITRRREFMVRISITIYSFEPLETEIVYFPNHISADSPKT